MRTLGFLLFLVATLSFSGCAAVDNLYPPPNKITESVDKDGNPVKVTEPAYRPAVDTGGFFESKNLSNFYNYQGKRSDNHKESAENKVAAINANAIKAAEKAATNTEVVLIYLLAGQQIAAISVDPPPDGLKPPATMADIFGQNFTNWANLGLNIYSAYKNNTNTNSTADDSPTINLTGNGNYFNYKSPNSFNPTYTISGESSGTWDTNKYQFDDHSTESKSTSTSLF